MHIMVQPQPDGAVRLTCARRHLQLQPGTILAGDDAGPLLLPTCPTRYHGILYVPTLAIVERLGGAATLQPGALQLQYGGQTALLPLAVPLPGAAGMAGITADLDDPRVPLDEVHKHDEQLKRSGQKRGRLHQSRGALRTDVTGSQRIESVGSCSPICRLSAEYSG